MKKITTLLIMCFCCICLTQIHAQEEKEKPDNQEKIERLKSQKEQIEVEEKQRLMEEVEAINERLDEGEISLEEANNLKKEAAKRRALNIENRLAIIDNKIALLERNEDYDADVSIEIDGRKNVYLSKIIKSKKRERKYDKRTFSYLTLAFGLNNAIIDGVSLDDTPYEVGGSRFFEIGWTWSTRVFKNTNFLRLKYGYSFQINGLRQKEDVIFVEDGDVTRLEPFPTNLRKSKLSNSNIVFPVYFEFGASKRIERENYFRYSTRKKFRVGVGGYAGFNIGTRQKLRFTDESGNRQKEKIRGDFNTTDFVYGVSTYIGFGNTSLYFKYDLSPIFRNQAVDQNNISLGIRYEL